MLKRELPMLAAAWAAAAHLSSASSPITATPLISYSAVSKQPASTDIVAVPLQGRFPLAWSQPAKPAPTPPVGKSGPTSTSTSTVDDHVEEGRGGRVVFALLWGAFVGLPLTLTPGLWLWQLFTRDRYWRQTPHRRLWAFIKKNRFWSQMEGTESVSRDIEAAELEVHITRPQATYQHARSNDLAAAARATGFDWRGTPPPAYYDSLHLEMIYLLGEG